MRRILLICKDKTTIYDINTAMQGLDQVLAVPSVEQVMEALEAGDQIHAVLIDEPSQVKNVERLIDYINQNNCHIFAIPVIMIVSEESIDDNLSYLGKCVVDFIRKPVHGRILQNRIERAVDLMNSVSFSEFARMLKVLPANIYLKDAKGRYVFSSQTWHHLDTGDDPEWTIRGKTDMDIRKDRENAILAMKSDQELIRSGKGTSYIIEENEDGIREYLQLIKEPLFDDQGSVQGIIALINDVTNQELMRQELERRSVTDELTGLYNRFYFEQYIRKLEDVGRYPYSIISLDCDNLKIVNDSCGHMVGDRYILMAVDLMRKIFPSDGLLFRTGGDEFVAILPDTDDERAKNLIKTLMGKTEGCVLNQYQLSISAGSSTICSKDESVDEHMKRADDAMYLCKQEHKKILPQYGI